LIEKALVPQSVDMQFVIQMQDIAPDLCMSHVVAEKINRQDIEFEKALGTDQY